MSRTDTAVLDRFEGDRAVLLIEADGETVDEVVVPTATLPEDARHQNAVVRVSRDDDGVVDVQYDAEATASRTETAQDRFDRLSRRPPGTNAPPADADAEKEGPDGADTDSADTDSDDTDDADAAD